MKCKSESTGCSSDSVMTEESMGDSDSKRSSFEFLIVVKKRFVGNPEIYREFLNAIVEYSRNNCQETDNFCVKIVRILFGQADLLHQFQGFFDEHDEKLRREIRRGCAFAIDDIMVEIEVILCNLRTTIEWAEDALRVPPSELWEFMEHEFVGMRFMGIRRIYGEWSEVMIEDLRKDPRRGLPVVLVRLREKERGLSVIRSAALQFLQQFYALNCEH